MVMYLILSVYSVQGGLILNRRYYHGFFNTAINLPADFTSEVVLAFYVSLNFLAFKDVLYSKAQKVNVNLKRDSVNELPAIIVSFLIDHDW